MHQSSGGPVLQVRQDHDLAADAADVRGLGLTSIAPINVAGMTNRATVGNNVIAVGGDPLPEEPAPAGERRVGGLLIRLHQAAVAHHVGAQDSR